MLVSDPIAALPQLLGASIEDLDRVIADFARPELRPTQAHRLARAHALGVRFERDHDPATLAAALDTYASCRYRGQSRGMVGRYLALRSMQAGLLGQPFDQVRIRKMIDDAGDDPVMPGSTAFLHALADTLAAYADDPDYDRTAALHRLDELAETVPPDSPYGRILPTVRMALSIHRGGMEGNYASATAAAEHARQMLANDDLDPGQRVLANAMLAGADGMRAVQHGDMDQAAERMLVLGDMIADLPPGDPAAIAMRGLIDGVMGSTRVEDADGPGLSGGTRAWRLLLAATPIVQRGQERKDPAELNRAARMLREAAQISPPKYPHRALIFSLLGQVLIMLCQLGAGRPALDEAMRWLGAAQREAGHPGHPIWAPTCMMLAHVHRLDGRPAQSRELGRRALRGHAWSVLLQAGAADAAAAARDIADDAKLIARWCLADGDPGGAATALDAGRCLMLYAATVTMDIPARLRSLGRPDLLSGWLRDSSDADLRADVLAALTGTRPSDDVVPDILDPPSLAEIGDALARLHADVLVYLLPSDANGPGCAVLVPAAGPVRAAGGASYIPLPELTATGVAARHVENLGTRDADAVESPNAGMADESAGADGWRSGLDRLCSWAWSAAIGPLLGVLDRWRIGRAPRIVLVAMGDLGAVPWHAARDRDGTRAVQLATFSYAASARLLCQNAGRPPVADRSPVLVVGDPTGDLPDARAEAEAIRSAFYPQADLLGTDATPDAVREWLLAGGGAVLHLACHGTVRSGMDGSHLRLSGGRQLTARHIAETRRKTAIGLVALAACTTGMPSGAYDESFSLTTAFLAAGARSVFGSLWPVPSDATSLLMFMAHHYLRSGGKRPMDALNHAQRWMLDPQRQAPPEMPADLAARLPSVDSEDTATWAGFLHQGY